MNSYDLIETLADLMLGHGIPEHLRSDNGPEFVAERLRKWLSAVGAKTLYIETSCHWGQGDDISMVEFRCTEYREGTVVADDALIQQILDYGIRAARATGMDSKTVILIKHRQPVKANMLGQVMNFFRQPK